MIELLNIDCMEYMKGLEDNVYELAIVDPPYGIGNWCPSNISKKGKTASKPVDWNNETPDLSYFKELTRVSKNQIIWGANYYNCFTGGGSAVIWYKGKINPVFSQCEIASLSWGKKVDYVHIDWQAGFYRNKFGAQIHPCQKPVKLYEWLLSKYAKEGDRILDTHLGSGSSAIAAHYGGFDFVGCELDEDYFKAAQSRFEKETAQLDIFQ
jgi:site-specific DNA-methyltransferase (adenine-specific)